MIRKIYAGYSLFIFLIFFLLLYPFMFVAIQFKAGRNINHWLYRIWGYLTLFFCGVLRKTIREFKPLKGQAYIYCANHTSFLDIPALYCAILQDVSFIGKSSLGKVPLFGYVYSRIHILVDRKSRESKQETILRSSQALDDKTSLLIFPEGTIPKYNNPHMIEFKEGAFRIAIEKQIPIVPVTMPFNYLILPDEDKMNCRPHKCIVVLHKPIETKGLTVKDTSMLKEQTRNIITTELKKYGVI